MAHRLENHPLPRRLGSHLQASFWGIVSNIMGTETELKTLKEYLAKVPSINPDMSSGIFENGCWWVKFQIDTHHKLAWRVVQELGHLLNYMSLKSIITGQSSESHL